MKKIFKSNVQTAFQLLIVIVFMFVFEMISFGKYVENRADSAAEAFGIIGIIVYALIFSVALLACAVGKLVIGLSGRKAEETKLKKWIIASIVVRFITAIILVGIGIVFLCIYRGGYVGKCIYCLVALLESILAVNEIRLLQKFN